MKSKRKLLRKLNAEIVAKAMLPAMNEKVARRRAAQALADGKASKADVKHVETAHRKSRRDSADYQRGHVHHDPNTLESVQVAASPSVPEAEHTKAARTELEKINQAEARRLRKPAQDDKPAEIEERAQKETQRDARTAAERDAEKTAEATEAVTDADCGTVERISFGDRRGAENTDDAENFTTSSGDSFATGKFKETERRAAAALAAARERDRIYYEMAWQAFRCEPDHELAAAEIDKVWTRATDLAQALQERDPSSAFAIALASFLKHRTSPGAGRANRLGIIAGYWSTWNDYRKKWRAQNPNASLPWQAPAGGEHRHSDPMRAPQAVARVLRGWQPPLSQVVPAAVRTPDPWEAVIAAWEADGMPLNGGELLALDPKWPRQCLTPLDRVLEEQVKFVDSPFRAAVIRERARADWWNQYRYHKPRRPSNDED